MTKTNVKNRVTGNFYHPCVIKSSLYLCYWFLLGLVIVVSVLITYFV